MAAFLFPAAIIVSLRKVCTVGNVLATCDSSARFKTNIGAYTGGLDLVRQLQPVAFDWKSDGSHDLGFVAEDVAAIDPLLATYRDGQVEGVKYDRLTTVLVNGMNEQQPQIDALANGITPADDARLDAFEARLVERNGMSVGVVLAIALAAGLVVLARWQFATA